MTQIEADQARLSRVVEAVSAIPGVAAIVLGGSRARGAHHAKSDFDIGLYYRGSSPFDPRALDAVAAGLDDEGRTGLATDFGGWGPWVDGGAWLAIDGIAVDFIYRDLERVDAVIEDCRRGAFRTAFQVGHVAGYPSTIYAGELALCQPLWDPNQEIAPRKARLTPFPEALRSAIVTRHLNEARFCMQIAAKGAARGDTVYVAGCGFRVSACLMQAIFALNGQWLINEKGSVALAETFATRPPELKARLDGLLGALGGTPASLGAALSGLEALIEETAALS